jgi:hypothetical protein
MVESLLVLLALVLLLGWQRSHKAYRAVLSRPVPELRDSLLSVTQSAWVTTNDTLFTLSRFPPFSDSAYGSPTKIGVQYRDELYERSSAWLEIMEDFESPLSRGVAALTSFDSVLTKYSSQIAEAHRALMKHYEHKPMPVRNQDGFNWEKLW